MPLGSHHAKRSRLSAPVEIVRLSQGRSQFQLDFQMARVAQKETQHSWRAGYPKGTSRG